LRPNRIVGLSSRIWASDCGQKSGPKSRRPRTLYASIDFAGLNANAEANKLGHDERTRLARSPNPALLLPNAVC
jgi:hypothetical protein